MNQFYFVLPTVIYPKASSFASPSCCKLSPNGSLSLGAGHVIVDGDIQAIPYSSFPGKLSMFRIWGKERSEEEVTSLKCTEGDIVKWEEDHWDTLSCQSSPDLSLLCGEFTFFCNVNFNPFLTFCFYCGYTAGSKCCNMLWCPSLKLLLPFSEPLQCLNGFP